MSVGLCARLREPAWGRGKSVRRVALGLSAFLPALAFALFARGAEKTPDLSPAPLPAETPV